MPTSRRARLARTSSELTGRTVERRTRAAESRAALERARARLDRLDLYPRPVRLEGVRLVTLSLFFRLPRLRRYSGYALVRTIVLRRPLSAVSDDLVCHELCHLWQMQNRPLHVVFTYLTSRYRDNPYEAEARFAVRATGEPAEAFPAVPAG